MQHEILLPIESIVNALFMYHVRENMRFDKDLIDMKAYSDDFIVLQIEIAKKIKFKLHSQCDCIELLFRNINHHKLIYTGSKFWIHCNQKLIIICQYIQHNLEIYSNTMPSLYHDEGYITLQSDKVRKSECDNVSISHNSYINQIESNIMLQCREIIIEQRSYDINNIKINNTCVEVTLPIESIITAWLMYFVKDYIKQKMQNYENSHIFKTYIKDFLDLENGIIIDFLNLENNIRNKIKFKFDIKFKDINLIYINNKQSSIQNMKSIFNIYFNLCCNNKFYYKIKNLISYQNINEIFHAGSKLCIEQPMKIYEYIQSDVRKKMTQQHTPSLLLQRIPKNETFESENDKIEREYNVDDDDNENYILWSYEVKVDSDLKSKDIISQPDISIGLSIEYFPYLTDLPIDSIIAAYLLYFLRLDLSLVITENCFENYYHLMEYFNDFLKWKNEIRYTLKHKFIVKQINIGLLFADIKKTMIQNLNSIFNIFCNLCIHKDFFYKIAKICIDLNNDDIFISGSWIPVFPENYMRFHEYFKCDAKKKYIKTNDFNVTIKIMSPITGLNILKFNTSNVDKCCKILRLHNINGNQIEADIDWNWLCKKNHDLLSRMTDAYLTCSSNGVLSFLPCLPDDMKCRRFKEIGNRMNNCFILTRLLLRNHRYKYNIMRKPILWRFIFNTLKELIRCNHQNHRLSDIYVDLILMLIQETMSKWTYEHIQYIDNINIFEDLCIMIKERNVHHHKTCPVGQTCIDHVTQIMLHITQVFYMLSKDVLIDHKSLSKYDDHYIKKFRRLMRKHLNKFENNKKNRKYRERKSQFILGKQQMLKYQKGINKFLDCEPNEFKDLPFIKEKNNKSIKVCRNAKCNKSNFDGGISSFKICSKCKSVFYCTRKCQKIDWNECHRKHCYSLSVYLYL